MTEQNQQDDFDDGFTDSVDETAEQPREAMASRGGGLMKPLLSVVALAVVTGAGFFGYKTFLAPAQPLNLAEMQTTGMPAPMPEAAVSDVANAPSLDASLPDGIAPAPVNPEVPTDGATVNNPEMPGSSLETPVGTTPNPLNEMPMPEQVAGAGQDNMMPSPDMAVSDMGAPQVDLMGAATTPETTGGNTDPAALNRPAVGDEAVQNPVMSETQALHNATPADAPEVTQTATDQTADQAAMVRPDEMALDGGVASENVAPEMASGSETMPMPAVTEGVTVAPSSEQAPAMETASMTQTEETSMPAPAVAEVEALNEELSSKAEELADLKSQNTALQKEIDRLKAERSASSSSTQDHAKAKPTTKRSSARPSKKATKAKVETSPAQAARAFSEKMRSAENRVPYVLRSAQPGVAWVSTSDMGDDLKEVRVGQFLKGYGQISAIVRDQNGAWVVKTQEGEIRRN